MAIANQAAIDGAAARAAAQQQAEAARAKALSEKSIFARDSAGITPQFNAKAQQITKTRS